MNWKFSEHTTGQEAGSFADLLRRLRLQNTMQLLALVEAEVGLGADQNDFLEKVVKYLRSQVVTSDTYMPVAANQAAPLKKRVRVQVRPDLFTDTDIAQLREAIQRYYRMPTLPD